MYTVALYLHIMGALILFSAVGIEWMCLSNLRKSETREGIISWLKNFAVLKKLFMTAFFFLLIPGIYMMAEIWVDAAWAILGIAGLLALSISGSVLSGKKLLAIKKTLAQSETEFPLSKLLLKVRDNYFWYSFLIRACTAFGIVFLMTFKTNFADSIIVLAIAILIGYMTAKITRTPELEQETEINEEGVLQ
jgi:hypothetical protein